MKKKWNYLLNGLGVAIIGVLLGSNVEYATNNYGILTHNLSYAVLSSTGGETSISLLGYDDIETYSAIVTGGINLTDRYGDPLVNYDLCPKMFDGGGAQAWAIYKLEGEVKNGEVWNVAIEGVIHSAFIGSEEDKEMITAAVTYEKPVCMADRYSCCYTFHPKQKIRNVTFSIEK